MFLVLAFFLEWLVAGAAAFLHRSLSLPFFSQSLLVVVVIRFPRVGLIGEASFFLLFLLYWAS